MEFGGYHAKGHVPVLGVCVKDRRYPPAKFSGEISLVQIGSAKNVVVEHGNESEKMPCAINRGVVQQNEVLIDPSSPNGKTGRSLSLQEY